MSTKRTVVRKYWSKKKRDYVTKTYTYEGKSRRGKVLVSKSGKVNKKNVEAYRQQIDNNDNFSQAEKRMLKADLDNLIRQRSKNGQKMTTTGFEGYEAETRVERFFVNAGYSVSEAAETLGVSEEELYDENNWQGNVLTVGGQSYEVKFNYTESMFQPL